mmetsp:Transcript_53325/g.141354  ORF Transcript_53325/g.141354 Transcript_53325/m.141354 type:complete len:86 (-) Transcript_53325:497-754(-)
MDMKIEHPRANVSATHINLQPMYQQYTGYITLHPRNWDQTQSIVESYIRRVVHPSQEWRALCALALRFLVTLPAAASSPAKREAT